jgi:DNA-binding XRE family transcriptional regulator
VNNTVGETIAALRKKARHSQRSLAEAAGLSRQAVAMIEKGTAAPSLETARKIAQALGVSLSVFDLPA